MSCAKNMTPPLGDAAEAARRKFDAEYANGGPGSRCVSRNCDRPATIRGYWMLCDECMSRPYVRVIDEAAP